MGNISKDWVDAYLEYGIDCINRRIFLLSDIEDEHINKIIKGIYLLDAQDDKKPIELFVSSFGGDVYEMLALYDVLNTTTCPIHTVAIGKCMSAAPLIVAAGKKGERYTMPNTQWMIHQMSLDLGFDRQDHLKIDMQHIDNVKSTWADLLAKHSKLKKNEWVRLFNKVGDQYFSAEDAIEKGLVDHIWSEK
jgi:ATP-dependent Clp protease protease subunit